MQWLQGIKVYFLENRILTQHKNRQKLCEYTSGVHDLHPRLSPPVDGSISLVTFGKNFFL